MTSNTRGAVASLIVASDVWAESQKLPRGKIDGLGLPVRVDPWLPRGCIIPLDANGRPILGEAAEDLARNPAWK